jgi:cathepsin C
MQKSEDDLPRCHDWRNYNNSNFDNGITHQGDCGSCYVLSALSALESRIKIKTNLTVKLSKSGTLSCDLYNQGCNGGYPELVYKFGME